MPLRPLMQSILMSNAAQSINFNLDAIHIDGSGLSFVALALVSPPQGFQGVSLQIAVSNPAAAAFYNPTNNTFFFPSLSYGTNAGTADVERMTILHECIHCLRDTYGAQYPSQSGGTITRAASEEAAALLAGALFYINDNQNVGIPPYFASGTTGSGPIYGLAFALAQQLNAFTGTTNENSFSYNYVGQLESAISAFYTNTHLWITPNTMYDNNGLQL